ncbi:MAG: helix-turn-helix transcriptional regulator [Oscillospiraceae bacterium]|nr:helix-turn-helix transcriptional regulator [Oscillospiraceae bacterium]
MQLPQIEVFGIYNSRIIGPDGKVSKRRKTSMFEIELPIEPGGISYIDGDSYPITPDTIVCAKPGQSRCTKFPYQCYYIHMLIPDPALAKLVSKFPDFFRVADRSQYEALFARLCSFENTHSQEDELILQSIVLALIHTINNETNQNAQTRKRKYGHYFEINAVFEYIKQNLCEDLCLDNVAKKFSLSPIHFHSLFKTAVGVTLHEYVLEQRLKNAMNLLLVTNMTLTQIAYASGFSSQSYFSFVFKKKTGKTPRQYARSVYKKYEK